MTIRNPVAKNAHKFNRCQTFRDRKKQAKQGYEKHRKQH